MINQAIILAAGYGSRLKPLTNITPKPLIKIGRTTPIDEVITKLQRFGIKKIIVNTHHLAPLIHQHLAKYSGILFSYEPEILETGGAIAKMRHMLGDEPFFSINADILWWDKKTSLLEQMNNAWDENKMECLLSLIQKECAFGYEGIGDYNVTENNYIQKRKEYEPGANYVYMGVQILSPAVFQKTSILPGQSKFSITKIFNEIERRRLLKGLVYDGDWADIGTHEALAKIREMILKTN